MLMNPADQFPPVLDPSLVGKYQALAKSGGGFVWDAVLEYRVWCHPEPGAPDAEEGNDYYCAFSTYTEALAFADENRGAEQPLALVLQEEYINEPSPGQYVHVRERRITEWPVEFLARLGGTTAERAIRIVSLAAVGAEPQTVRSSAIRVEL
jgi:hypothetical protein